MQFVGLLLIVNSLIGGAWWVTSGRPQAVVLPICVAALAAGVFLIIHDRTTAPRGGGATAVPAAGGLEELTKQTEAARSVLLDLQDQTAAADWHLKQLDEHIKAMRILPDGRTRIGNTVTGQPSILVQKLESLQKLAADRNADSLPLARESVKIYEATLSQLKDAVLVSGDLGPETYAWLYVTACTAAQRAEDHDQALVWARDAVALRPNAERQFLLVTALMNKSLQTEANTVIQQGLKMAGAEGAKFRGLLDQYKIPYK